MSLLKKRTSRSGDKSRSSQRSSANKRILKKPHRNGGFRKPVLNSQQVQNEPLLLKKVSEPKMVKMSSEVIKAGYMKKKVIPPPVLDLKNELLYKRDLEVKQRFPKGKFIIAYEPAEKQEFYVMRLKECLTPKKKVAWVDFYDLTTQNEEIWQFSKQEEGLVQWDNMIAVLNIKVKPIEEIHSVTFLTKSGLIDKIHGFMGKNKPKKRSLKSSRKEERKSENNSDYSPSDSEKTESINLLPSDSEEEIDTKPNKKQKKFKKRAKLTAGQKAAIEEKKRKDAENVDRRINGEYPDSGIRIVKTRFINDTEETEIVEVDPCIKEVRPKKWKFIEREENKNIEVISEEIMRFSHDSNLNYLENSAVTSNRNIIRAALTDNVELAKLCIEEKSLVTSLMESWSPEIKSTALESAISCNSRKVLELLLKHIEDNRESNYQPLIKKFDTGQVDERAFGTKVRKVEMMRGGRQGNNAFMQDVPKNEEYKTMLDLLTKDEMLCVRAAYSCNIEISTLRLIFEILGEKSLGFFKEITYHILRTGRRHLAAECLEILRRIGDTETKESITDAMIDILQIEDYSKQKPDLTKLNVKDKYDGITYLHLACMNPNTEELVQELLKMGFSYDMKDKLGATPIFYAAVNPCVNTLSSILSDPTQYLRVYDKKQNTPLIMSIIGKRTETIHFILQTCGSAVKDKSILRLTPLNVACRNGYVLSVKTLMSYKGSAPNQPGGWEKMTPL